MKLWIKFFGTNEQKRDAAFESAWNARRDARVAAMRELENACDNLPFLNGRNEAIIKAEQTYKMRLEEAELRCDSSFKNAYMKYPEDK